MASFLFAVLLLTVSLAVSFVKVGARPPRPMESAPLRTNSSVRMPTLLHSLLIASRQQLTDTLQPPSAPLYRDQITTIIIIIRNLYSAIMPLGGYRGAEDLIFVIPVQQRTLICTQRMRSCSVSPCFGVRVTFGLKNVQTSRWPNVRFRYQYMPK